MSDTYCVYPFINVHTNTDGRCKLCCHVYSEDYIQVDGKDAVLGKTDWYNIWGSKYMLDVRAKMLGGGKVKECNRCYEHEEKGLESSRQWANKNYRASVTHGNPTHLELRLGNHCNLKCNSCWSVSSDNIYKERKKILANETVPQWLNDQWQHEIKSVEAHDWSWYETQEFKDFIDAVAPTLERLYLTGGEPTLIQANQYVLDKLVEAGNRKCHVAWTTNMTTWPEGFYDKLAFFNSSEIQMSIDGYKSHNAYIRYPTDWNKLEENFEKALKLPSTVQLKIYFVYQAWNVFDVGDLIGWLESKQGDRRVDFVPIFLEHPEQIHSCVWPDHVKLRVLEKLHNLTTLRHQDAVSRIINYTHNTTKYSKENMKRMREFIDINDRYRRHKFNSLFYELNDILENECRI
jgi:sulfatase maturation enzyme AslB (radical SAM superfamily)|tara:strand:+ start:9527 stop:10738 length:1212 start_codon:yes stop_codon:yes gene_type:complete